MSEADLLVQIKGLRDGLLVSLTEAPWDEQRAALLSHIEARQSFFHGARLALEVGNQVLHVNELVNLRDDLSERGVSLWAVISDSPTTEKTAQLLGLATRISRPRPQESRQFTVEDLGDETALFLGRTLRSGTRIDFPGHVVVVGDVNPGAEIIAEGSILVWGRLRGSVHAGAKGEASAVICALELSPMQLRIGDESAALKTPTRPGPTTARLEKGRMILAPWQDE